MHVLRIVKTIAIVYDTVVEAHYCGDRNTCTNKPYSSSTSTPVLLLSKSFVEFLGVLNSDGIAKAWGVEKGDGMIMLTYAPAFVFSQDTEIWTVGKLPFCQEHLAKPFTHMPE